MLPTPKPEPPCETRTEVTESEAHRENVHPSDPGKENQKPTHAVKPGSNPAHKAEAVASSDGAGAKDHDASSTLAQASEAVSPDGRAMSVAVPVESNSTEKLDSSDAAIASHDEVVVNDRSQRNQDDHDSTFGQHRATMSTGCRVRRCGVQPSAHVRNSTRLISHVKKPCKTGACALH